MEIVKRRMNQKIVGISTLVIVLVLLLGYVPYQVIADNPTQIYVNPSGRTVSAGQTFIMTISCTPGQPIKSYEFKVLFNPLFLSANSVNEGNIFNGYTTFFNDGTIDNTAGSINDIYGLIIGPGLVSTPGSLVTISFTAKLASGTSIIALSQVGVTNATEYVPIAVTNGTVVLREFTLSITIDGSGSVSKNPNQATYPYGTVVQLTAVASTGWTFSSWTGNISGSTNPASITMNGNKSVTAHFMQNQYTLTITVVGSGSVTKTPNQATYPYGQVVTLTAVPGTGYLFSSWTGDVSGSQNPTTITMNGNRVVTAHFQDSAPPQITGITRTTSNPLDTNLSYGWVNISCTVTDNVAVSQVTLRIHSQSGSWNNVTMAARGTGQYYYRSSTAFSIAGNYSYFVRATDSNNNVNNSNIILFSMPANWDIDGDGMCAIFDFVLISNHYGENGALGWIREDADNNGIIQVIDLVYLSNHYGETWWV